MIGELKNPPVINISRQESEEKPHGNFVLLPAPNGTLLVKSIAVQELLLPKQCVIDACIYLWNVLYEGQICY